MSKNSIDLIISSQAAEESVEGSETRLRSPDRTVEAHECATLKKICNNCCQYKFVYEYYPRYATCKECTLEKQKGRSKEYYRENKDKICARTNAYYSENKDKYLEYKRVNRANNYEREAELSRECRQRNLELDPAKLKAKEAFHAAKRRASKKNATPKWADLAKIRDIYSTASALGMSVDHVIPLQHSRVCGLHVENNLRILPIEDNCRKSNSFSEDIVRTILKGVEE
jgi:hypothetical protein